MLKFLRRENEGITLVALVITILILLILVAITISSLGGENGLLSKAKQSKAKQIEAEMQETLTLALQEKQLEKKGEGTLEDITQEWLEETIKKYKSTIEEDMYISNKKVVMEKQGIKGEFLIDSKLNIVKIDSSNNKGEFLCAVLDNTNKEQIKIQIEINNLEGIEYIETPEGNKINANELKDKKININVEENTENIIKIKKNNGEEIEKKININEEYIKRTTLGMETITEVKGYKSIDVEKKIEIENYDKVYYKLSKEGEWIEGRKFSIVDYDVIQNGKVEEDGTVTIFAKVVNSGNNDQVIISNKVKVDTTQVNETTQSMQGESLLKIVEENNLKTGKYEVTVSDEKYNIKLYNIEKNVTMSADTTFGVEQDVGKADEGETKGYAQNMIVVKVNGDLNIEEDVKLTSYASKEGYGGPKGMLVYCTGTLTNKGTISMTARGAKAEGQNVYLWKNAKYENEDKKFEYVPKVGANGGNKSYIPSCGATLGNVGGNGINRQTRWRGIWIYIV